MARSILTASVIAVLILSAAVSAKRGCSAFGHSCYGGHGKRSDSSIQSPRELLSPRQMGQAETPPHPIYPQPYGILPSGDDIIPIRDGGAYDPADSRARDAMKMKLRNILRHWMDYYRQVRQSNDDGFLFETM